MAETRFAPWLIGTVAQIINGKGFDESWCGGINGTSKQASLLNDVEKACAGTPLSAPFRATFNRKLRNSKSHNDYIVSCEANGFTLKVITTGEILESDEVAECLMLAESLLDGALNVFEHLRAILPASGNPSICARGIKIAGYPALAIQPYHLQLFQTWCFWELDPNGTWLEQSTIQFAPIGGSHWHVAIGENSCSIGLLPDVLPSQLGEIGWALVERIPLAPRLHEHLPEIRFENGSSWCVYAPPTQHWVRIEVLDHVTLHNCRHAPGALAIEVPDNVLWQGKTPPLG